MNPQYSNEMLYMYVCPEGQFPFGKATRLKHNALKSFKSYGAKIWTLLPASYKVGLSFETLKKHDLLWTNLQI